MPKVQTQIQGAQVRVLGKSKDDLQKAIAAVKEHDFGARAAVHELPPLSNSEGASDRRGSTGRQIAWQEPPGTLAGLRR